MDMNPQSAGISSPQKHRPRVFVVDDALVVRNLVIECVGEIAGLEVAGFAGSEETALSWLRSHPCDVLILDLELRQGSGLGLLKTLASPLASPEPPSGLLKIVFSNHADENSRRIAAQLGAAHFFDKMLDADKLRLLLQDIAAAAA